MAAALFRLMAKPAVVTAALIATLWALSVLERAPANMPFVALVIASIAGMIFLVSRRLAFSAYAAMALVVVIAAASAVKYRLKGFGLHVFDFAYTGTDPAAARFVVEEYAFLLVPFGLAVLAGMAALVWFARLEAPTALPWRRRFVIAFAAACGLYPSYPLAADHPRYFHYLGGFDASTFFVSLLDLQYLVSDTSFADRLERMPRQASFPDSVNCGGDANRPDVFIVLSESQTAPEYFPRLQGAADLAASFRSPDGKLRSLQVETFGGGTWISNLSVMTGLSSADFGFQGPYLTTMLEGRVHGALPELLSRCGYRTVAILPTVRSFVNEGPFLESIGFETVLDKWDIGAEANTNRDEVYFAAAEKVIREHHASDSRPLLLLVETMFAHSPYNEPLAAQSGGPVTHRADEPELEEYLNRVALSRADLAGYLTTVAGTVGRHGAVVLEYGDHQAFVTKADADEMAGGNALTDLDSVAYRTYYTVNAYGYALDMEAFPDRLDIGFLGAALLEAARLPTSPMYDDLIALKRACAGRFHGCADRAMLDRHLRRRVDSGLLDIL